MSGKEQGTMAGKEQGTVLYLHTPNGIIPEKFSYTKKEILQQKLVAFYAFSLPFFDFNL